MNPVYKYFHNMAIPNFEDMKLKKTKLANFSKILHVGFTIWCQNVWFQEKLCCGIKAYIPL